MNKLKLSIPQMRSITICYLNKIEPELYRSKSSEIYVSESTKGVKEFFSSISYTYMLLNDNEKLIVDRVLVENSCIPLKDADLEFFKPTQEQLDRDEGFQYLKNFCKYIKDLKYYHPQGKPEIRTKENAIMFESCLSMALEDIKNYHKDCIATKLSWYLEKTADAIISLSPEEFNKIDVLAKKHNFLTIKEAFDKFPSFRKSFKEGKYMIESSDFFDWRGTGTYYPAKRKKKSTLIDDPKMYRVSFEMSEKYMHPISENQKNVIEIEYTGSYSKDAEQAYNLSNIPRNDLYVWHYVGNYKPNTNTGEVELVLKEAHDAIEHATGVEDYEKLKGVTYTP